MPIELSLDAFVNIAIRSGSVLYYKDTQMPYCHYYIIINRDPIEDELLIMTMARSNYQRICEMVRLKENGSDQAFVYISHTETKIFPKDTGIDCGTLHTIRSHEILSLYSSGKLKWKGYLEKVHFDKIITATKNSDRVSKFHKKKLPSLSKVKSGR